MANNAPKDTDLMAPLDLSDRCDGVRTDFPLGIKVATARVVLNGARLLEPEDYLIGDTDHQSKLELKKAPPPGSQLIVMRAPA